MILSPERRRALTGKADRYADNLEAVLPYLGKRGIDEQAAEMFGLGCVPEGEDYAGRLTIPYHTPTGCVLIKYRCTEADHHDGDKHVHERCPKVFSEQGCGIHLFNAQSLASSSELVVVTEGELDAVCVQAYCEIPAVGYPGTGSWNKHSDYYRLCFESVAEVAVVADGDDPGRAAAARVAQSIGFHARVVDMPDGEDANSALARHGAAWLKERIYG